MYMFTDFYWLSDTELIWDFCIIKMPHSPNFLISKYTKLTMFILCVLIFIAAVFLYKTGILQSSKSNDEKCDISPLNVIIYWSVNNCCVVM